MNKQTFPTYILMVLLLAIILRSGGLWPVGQSQAEPLGQAGIPTLIHYQGFLTADNGQPLNATIDLTFRIYAQASGGSPLWQERQNGVTVSEGYFSVQLGSVTALTADVFDATERYLQITLDAGSGLGDLPRQRFAAVPYALRADEANNAATAGVAPWSGLSGVPAGFADGSDDVGGDYANVIVVAKSGGHFTSIQAALSSITDNSSNNRYLVWVAPGIYDETVTMKQYVDIEGAGELLTRITAPGSATAAGATVTGVNNAELRLVTVENTGGNTYAIAIRNNGSSLGGGSPRLTRVTARASGGASFNEAIVNVAGASPTMRYVTASASGGPTNIGIFNSNGAAPNMIEVTANASDGGDNSGVYNNASSATIRNSLISGSGGSGDNYGIRNYALSNTHTVSIHHSQIAGGSDAIWNDDNFITRVAASLLDGGTTNPGSGTLTCVAVYDQSFTFYGDTCP